MSKCLVVRYNVERGDTDIKALIQKLKNLENTKYFKRRSDSEVARMVLVDALKCEIDKLKEKGN